MAFKASAVVVVDFEFIATTGERPVPVCMVAHELRSGQCWRLWQDQFGPTPPYPITPKVAEQLAVLGATSTSAEAAFPDAIITGGSIGGMEIVVSDALAAGVVMLVDATAFIAASGDLELNIYEHASVQMDTTPDSPPTSGTNIINLWSLNLVGLIAERYFTVTKVRTNSVAQITGVDLGIGFSP